MYTNKKYLISYSVSHYEEIRLTENIEPREIEQSITGSMILDCYPTYQKAIEIIKENFKDLDIKQVVLLAISPIEYEEEYHGREIKSQ